MLKFSVAGSLVLVFRVLLARVGYPVKGNTAHYPAAGAFIWPARSIQIKHWPAVLSTFYVYAKKTLIVIWLFSATTMLGCTDGGKRFEELQPEPVATPFQELYDQGVDRYLGVFTPTVSEVLEGGATRHSFGAGDGPLCFTGNEFSMSTRDGVSQELMIFLQGGGACGPTSCEAVDVPWPILSFGILDPANAANPAADFNLGYVPYCDGTLFSGDRNVDSDGDGTDDRFFRGVQNLSASLDVIAGNYPDPTRILLAGNSAGGAGVHYALPLVRKLFPEVQIVLLNDSGVGIQQPGTQESLNEYWNSAAFFPESCSDCVGDDGNLTGYHRYQLNEDEQLLMGFISSTGDEVVAGRSGFDAALFGAELIAAMDEIEEAHPERFRSLISDTKEHTFIIKQFDFGVADTTVRQWVSEMLNLSEGWVSVRE